MESITQINSFAYGKKQVVFNLRVGSSNVVYFADTSDSDSMTDRISANYGCVTQYNTVVGDGYTVHSLYDVRDARLKTPNFKRSRTGSFNREFDLVDIYAPQFNGNMVDFAQLDGYMYLVTHPTCEGPWTSRARLRTDSVTDRSYEVYLSNEILHTYLYSDPSRVAEGYSSYGLYFNSLNSDADLDAEFTKLFTPQIDLSGVQYNYILEFPLSKEYNYYDQGILFCDPMIGKNAYNAEYTMNVQKELDGSYNISSCREYVGIGRCSDGIFLKYFDNKNFVKKSGTSLELAEDGVLSAQHMEIPTDGTKYKVPHIELIKSVNRYSESIKHKSNLFSLRLHDTGLNDNLNIPEDVKAKLRRDVTNYVRKATTAVCPASSQLFEVYFEGK